MAKRDLQYKKGAERFFKEQVWIVGVRTPLVRKVANKHFSQIKHLSKGDIFDLCERLLKQKTGEQKTIAFDWAFRINGDYTKSDFEVFEEWLKKYVKNWAHCDDYGTHALGSLLFQFPDLLKRSKKWTKSHNRWMRRAAAVTLIYHAKQKEKIFLKDMFWVADELLLDNDDLVQKGYGWMLKEASNFWQKDVFDFVIKRKDKMPRTALRYAIEKMPKSLKKRAMAK